MVIWGHGISLVLVSAFRRQTKACEAVNLELATAGAECWVIHVGITLGGRSRGPLILESSLRSRNLAVACTWARRTLDEADAYRATSLLLEFSHCIMLVSRRHRSSSSRLINFHLTPT